MITSPSNPLVKELVRLRSRRHRDAQGRFVIEGKRPVTMAKAAGVPVEQQVICPELGGVPLLDVPTVEMSEGAFRKASYRQNPDGVLVVARHLDTRLSRLELPVDPLVLIVESVEKPGNLGAMLRTCDAAGAAAMVVTGEGTDLHNPNVVRASQGALFTVPVAMADVKETIEWIRRRSLDLIAAVPGEAQSLWDADLVGPVALAIGAEDEGLSSSLLEAATARVTIPMFGMVDSLNAATSAALMIYEAVRQRVSDDGQKQ